MNIEFRKSPISDSNRSTQPEFGNYEFVEFTVSGVCFFFFCNIFIEPNNRKPENRFRPLIHFPQLMFVAGLFAKKLRGKNQISVKNKAATCKFMFGLTLFDTGEMKSSSEFYTLTNE